MFTHRLSSLARIGVIGSLSLYSFCAYANVDMTPDIRDCSEEKDFVQPVTNGSCYGVIIGRGKELIKNRGNGEEVVHRYPQGCGSAEPIDWKEENPEWKTKTCAPTFSCLENPLVDLTNASYVSVHEQPYENAPDVIAPIFPLAKDFPKVIVFANNISTKETVDGCEYTCNDGYRISTGACGVGTGNPVQATATLTGTIVPLTTDLKATITNGGSGYTSAPTITLTGCPNTVTATATLTGGAVTGVTIGGSGVCTSNTHTVTVGAPGGTGNTKAVITITGTTIPSTTPLKATITNGGSGYTSAPTITLTGCPNTVTATATLTGGAVTGIVFGGTGTCTTPAMVIAPPPATGGDTSGFSCNGAPTLTISAPTGTITGVAATLKLNTARTGVEVNNGGVGYTTKPAVIVVVPNNGTCSPYTPAVDTTVAGGLVTAAAFKVALPTVQVARGELLTNKLIFAVTNGGAGYTSTNPPVVTIGGLTGTGCTGLTATPRLNNRGELETVDDLIIPATCTGTPTVTISAPPALVSVTCPADTTFTVANPTGSGTVVTATATSNAQGVITITNPGAGYIANPTVTVNTTGLTCTKTPIAIATIDVAKKEVKSITFDATATGGTTATAISNTAGTIATIPTNGGGSGYTSAPLVTVTQGALGGCTTLPTATATIEGGIVTGVTLTGAHQCTVAPILTIAPPGTACTTGNTVTKCIANVCTGTVPAEALYCTDDKKIGGHEDVESVRRTDVAGCTAPQKCEWYCPTNLPVYCQQKNACVKNNDDCTCPTGQLKCSDGTCSASCNVCATSAPSELKTNIDQPIIQCNSVDVAKTHFRYKITKVGGTATDSYTSDLFTVGTSVKHPMALPLGTYTVTCLYGVPSTTESDMTAGTCAKTMVVKDGDVQGCSRIYGYKGSTLSDEMSSQSGFDASFRCGSRIAATGITNPYRLVVGTQAPAFLQYDADSTALFNSLALGPISTQTQSYSFNNATDVSCAVKVGDGYSTNNACKIRTCIGADCSRPQTFIVTPSANKMCTKFDTVSYDIGCNDASTDYARCAEWFNTTGDRTLKVNGTIQTLSCTSTTPPGAFGPVRSCTITLPTGGAPVELFSGDANSFQTTVYSLSKDTQIPTGTIEYTTLNGGTRLDASQYQLWQKQPIKVTITCNDQPGISDGSNCACASTLHNDVNGAWSLGQRSTNTGIGPDIMTYSRILFNNTNASYAVNVQDTAGNIGAPQTLQVGVDTVPPKVTARISGTTVTLSVSDPAEGGSGLWKAATSVANVTKNGAVFYRVGARGSVEFGESCAGTVNQTNYYRFGEAGAPLSQPSFNVNIGNATNNVVAYCVEDNAGNVTRGVYPSDITGCFSATNMSPVPTLSTYQNPLQTNITAGKYGYSLSEDQNNATCFRGILSSNISTLITNQYNANANTSLLWSQPATLKNTTTANTNGYYYHSFTTTTNTNNTVTLPTTNPTGTGQKVVVVDGGNIQINSNIDYAGTDKTLVLIARKNASGTAGGNIYINPSVTRIDAILIADGSLINATTTNGSATTSTTTTKNWIDNEADLSNRLIINGRIYSFNTRGGSLKMQGTNLVKIDTNIGRLFNGSSLIATVTPREAALHDLERFRVMLNDNNNICTLHVNYDTLSNNIPLILQKTSTMNVGNCSF